MRRGPAKSDSLPNPKVQRREILNNPPAGHEHGVDLFACMRFRSGHLLSRLHSGLAEISEEDLFIKSCFDVQPRCHSDSKPVTATAL